MFELENLVTDLKLLYANAIDKNTNFLFACKTGNL